MSRIARDPRATRIGSTVGGRIRSGLLIALTALVACERGGDVGGAAEAGVGNAEAVGAAEAAEAVTADAGASEGDGDAAPQPSEAQPPWLAEALADPPERKSTPAQALEPAKAGSCPSGKSKREGSRHVGVLSSPQVPAAGEVMRVWAADLESTEPLAMRIETLEGERVDVEVASYAGTPATALARFAPAEPGKYRIVVGRDGAGLVCREFWVSKFANEKSEPPEPSMEHVWRVRRSWSAAEEALYSAWIAALFDAPPQEDLAWASLHAVTSDPQRNLLFNHFGWEDTGDAALELTPDCADLPYFLRAYYSWKRGLPYGFSTCSRGKSDRAPRCYSHRSVDEAPDLDGDWATPEWQQAEGPLHWGHVVQRFFQRSLAWGVHTGNGRVALSDDENDLYPVELSARALRPGTVYADPYGHILLLTQFVPPVEGRPGVLYAVDGQPDASITRKRFWEGNFLWNPDPKLGGSGFKAFRPLEWIEEEVEVAATASDTGPGGDDGADATAKPSPPRLLPEGGTAPAGTGAASGADAGEATAAAPRTELRKVLRPVTDERLRKMKDYADHSLEQGKLDSDAFYDRMEGIISPGARDPLLALRESVEALAEAARIRVTSVNNGEKNHATNPEAVVEMPWGHSVFETTGAWENFSTPARDLRLLLAIDVVLSYEQKLRRTPEAFGLDADSVDAAVERVGALREHLLRDPRYAITYTRSDGSEQRLSLASIVERVKAFEMAYNPNDCPEIRWGAPEGSKEYATCRRHAPEDQRKMMAAYRVWFEARQRPARGDEGPDVPGVERPAPDAD